MSGSNSARNNCLAKGNEKNNVCFDDVMVTILSYKTIDAHEPL